MFFLLKAVDSVASWVNLINIMSIEYIYYSLYTIWQANFLDFYEARHSIEMGQKYPRTNKTTLSLSYHLTLREDSAILLLLMEDFFGLHPRLQPRFGLSGLAEMKVNYST
jgi:hypothetical protein